MVKIDEQKIIEIEAILAEAVLTAKNMNGLRIHCPYPRADMVRKAANLALHSLVMDSFGANECSCSSVVEHINNFVGSL